VEKKDRVRKSAAAIRKEKASERVFSVNEAGTKHSNKLVEIIERKKNLESRRRK